MTHELLLLPESLNVASPAYGRIKLTKNIPFYHFFDLLLIKVSVRSLNLWKRTYKTKHIEILNFVYIVKIFKIANYNFFCCIFQLVILAPTFFCFVLTLT